MVYIGFYILVLIISYQFTNRQEPPSPKKKMSDEINTSKAVIISAKPDRKFFGKTRKSVSGVPTEILTDPELVKALSVLPQNYNFEVPKTIWRIKKCNSKCVALQFPEGLLMFALTISDILETFTGVQTIIMGDVTYGACCVDDFTARALGADLMVHYGHSCLIPINMTENISMLYIFVDIKIDTLHAIKCVEKNFDKSTPLALISTIQFVATLQHIASELKSLGYIIEIPQCKPLSPGEVLGCTSPKIKKSEAVIFIGDGRFHLESVMIANSELTFYRYNPYDKTITEEYYDYTKMSDIRNNEVKRAASGQCFAIILGTLGRQGSPKVLETTQMLLKKNNKHYITVLMSEIFPEKLKLFSGIDAWVQIACPRLSIDWGYAFDKPLLTPYELTAAMKSIEWKKQYPMDFYASQSLGQWTPNHKFSPDDTDKLCSNCKECNCSDDKNEK